jgi:hypothetical protein
VFTAGAYIIGFSLLIWWHLHPGRRGEGKATCEIIQEDAEAAPIASSPSKMRLLSRSGTKFHDEAPHDLVEIEGDDLIDTTGISGMCVLPPCQMGGITGVPDRLAVPILFVQAVGLQALLLFNILPRLSPNMDDSHSSPNVLVFVAIYLHFLNCVQDLPYGIQIFYYFTDLHTELRDVLWFGVVLLADAFVIPSICFILGAFFICTSRTVIDVIMNAVAVSFVKEIDNWIIAFNMRTGFLGGINEPHKVTFPVGAKRMTILSLVFVYYPVVPACITGITLWVGKTLLQL